MRLVLPDVDPATGGPWDVGQLRHWADRLEAFGRVSAWLGALADAVEASAARPSLRDRIAGIDPKSYAGDPGFSVAISRALAVLAEEG